MDIFGDIGTLFFLLILWVILPMAVLVAVGVAIRKHFVEKAEEAASIARIQAPKENIWPPQPSHTCK